MSEERDWMPTSYLKFIMVVNEGIRESFTLHQMWVRDSTMQGKREWRPIEIEVQYNSTAGIFF